MGLSIQATKAAIGSRSKLETKLPVEGFFLLADRNTLIRIFLDKSLRETRQETKVTQPLVEKLALLSL